MFGIQKIKEDISIIKAELEKKPNKLEKDVYERLADLEIKMSKLWSLLLETNQIGKEKLTKFGKLYGGKAKITLGHNQ
jgi:hypothetical protein